MQVFLPRIRQKRSRSYANNDIKYWNSLAVFSKKAVNDFPGMLWLELIITFFTIVSSDDFFRVK